jgi:hypothetical protein
MNPELTFCQLFKLLRRQRNLAERRDPIFEANKAAKWLIGITMAFMIVYLIMIAILLALTANDTRRYTAIEFIMAVSPFIMLLDYWVRFLVQQTPSQIIKPYVTLPIPKYTCIDSFIITSLFNWGNTIWFTLLIPYCLMSVVFSYGFFASISLLLLFYIMILADSQWYSIIRTLTSRHTLWWLLPIGLSVAIISPWIIVDFDFLLKFYAGIGTGIESGNVLPHFIALTVLVLLVYVNRKLQYNNVMLELGKIGDTAPAKVYDFKVLNRLGVLGEYLKLEVKLLSRNKNPRKGFIGATAIIIVISAIISFTEIYDTQFMTNFWCIYNFVIYAAMLLIRVMSYEGNYIDVLMVHKENILKLLTSKYYFFCLLLILPFLLMLPMVIVGKWDMLMLVSYGIFTAGFQHFLLLQLAVYNNKPMPLNEKFIGKGGVDNNYIQTAEAMMVFFFPLVTISILESLLSNTHAWLFMMAIGLAFIATHKLWLRNIYNRLMKRKYKNMESFHA